MKYEPKGLSAQSLRHLATRDLLAVEAGSDLEAAHDARLLLERLKGAKAETTSIEHDRVVDRFQRFAKVRHSDPWAGNPQIIAAWLYSAGKHHTKHSIQRRAAIVRDEYIGRGLADPTQARLVVETLAALLSDAPTRRRTHDILLTNDFRALKRTMTTRSLAGLRDVIILGFGFVLTLKPDAILRLTGADVSVSADILTVRSTFKGKALLQRIASIEGDGLVEQVGEYLERVQIGAGALFPSVENDRVSSDKAIGKARLDRMFKDRLILAGYEPSRYCWTSLRYGFLYSGRKRGIDDAVLAKRAGFETVGHLTRILDDTISGSGGFRLPAADEARPMPMLAFDREVAREA
ncbi:MAG: hypothetical protein IAI50_16090 [Candidatus Eremiobacteraeota bacterium]|nr:hypothetical protein [Candidatus Eremiobacteraeota bacterium]